MTRAKTMPEWARAPLSAFPFADEAAKLWPHLHRTVRERVLAAARAEIAASRAYCVADDAIERAKKARERAGRV